MGEDDLFQGKEIGPGVQGAGSGFGGGVLPEPEAAPGWDLYVDTVDGQAAKRFSPDGPVEVWVTVVELPGAGWRREGRDFVNDETGGHHRPQLFSIPFRFESYANAEIAAELFLAHGLERLQGDLHGAAELARRPALAAPHRHTVVYERFARTMPFRAVCGVCMAVLVDDVPAWAADRGLVEHGRPLSDLHGPTLRGIIETQVNA